MAVTGSGREDQLAAFRAAASALLIQLQPAARTKLLRTMAHDLRRSQQQRIRAQIGPDGVPWTPRKRRSGREKAGPRPIRFLYHGARGEPRAVEMRSWVSRGGQGGGYIIGFDKEAEGVRTFRRDRIIRYLPIEGGTEDPGALQGALRGKKGGLNRRGAMFGKIRSGRFLKAGADPSSAWVEFVGRAQRIAAVHHFGLRDRVVQGGPEYDYPQRELLGLGQTDEEALMSRLLEHVSGAVEDAG